MARGRGEGCTNRRTLTPILKLRSHPQHLRILSALLAMPEADALEVLRDLLPQAVWLAGALAELEQMPLEHWQAEHTRLFVNGYPKTLCPPFESAYREGIMGGTAVGTLAALYGRAGLQATEAPADYLGTLLECAAFLTEQGDQGELLSKLWNDHLNRWVPRFARDLQTHSDLALYRELGAQLARIFPGTDDD